MQPASMVPSHAGGRAGLELPAGARTRPRGFFLRRRPSGTGPPPGVHTARDRRPPGQHRAAGAAGEGPAAALEHPPPAPGAGAPAARSTPGPGRAATGGLAAPLPAAPAPPGAARWAGCCRASSPPSPPLRRGRWPRLRQESGWRSGRARGAAAAPGTLPSPPGGRSGRARTGAAPAAGPPGAVVRARPAAPGWNTETRRHGVKLHLFLK